MSQLASLGISPQVYESAEIQFGEWLPDVAAKDNPGGLEALNVLPGEGAYIPIKAHVPVGGALSYPARGATAVILPTDAVQIYVGTREHVVTRIGVDGPWVGVFIGTSNDDYSWKFIRVNEQMVMIHREHTPQRTPVGTTTASVNLGGSPPMAACGAQVGDFLMLGNLLSDPDDGGNPFPSRVRWSGFNNIDLPWVSDPITQADFQDMPAEGGPVVAIQGREFATIFQARMISRASYRGPPNIFDIAVVEDKRGCIARDCVVDVGPVSFFIAEDGFFQWNGTNSTPIGDMKINRYFFSRLQWSKRSRIVGAHDPENGCVWWAFPTDLSGTLNEIIIYSYRENRFTHSVQTIDYLFTSANSSITLDELDEPLESYDISFDSGYFQQGGRQRIAAFNSLHEYGLYQGSSMAATMDTGEYSGPNSQRVLVDLVRPIIDLAIPLATVQAITRNQVQGGALNYGVAVGQEIDGSIPLLAEARYIRFRLDIPAGASWTHGSGLEISRRTSGVF